MSQYNRRDFLKKTAAGAGAILGAGVASGLAESSSSIHGSDIVPLGKTGINVSRLAQGTGFNGYARSSDHTRLGKAALESLLHHSYDQGIRFFDMADLYGTHPYVREVIKGLPRDQYVLLSKIWAHKENWVTPSGGAVEEVNRFRKELGVDQLDICLIHCMSNAQWPVEHARVRDEMSALKQKGALRAVGVSCHDFGALKVAASDPWVDVIFARINHKGGSDYSMDGTAEEVSGALKTARANGKAVVGMKIFGAGKLIKPEEKDASLNYVFNNKLVDAITIGMLKKDEVNDSLSRISQVRIG